MNESSKAVRLAREAVSSQKLGVGILVVALLGLSQIGVITARNQAEATADSLLARREGSSACEAVPVFAATIPQDAPVTKRMAQQLKVVCARKAYHAYLLKYFFARYYMAISVAPAAAIIAAAMLLLITRGGWDTASPFVKATFLVMTGIATFYGPFPRLYKQDENAARNGQLYISYGNLEQEMLTYLATGPTPSDTLSSPPRALRIFDKRMTELNEVAIGFDATQVADPKAAFKLQ